MSHQEKEFPNDSGRPLSGYNFIDNKAKWLLLRSLLFLFSPYSKSSFLQMTKKFELV